MNSGNYPRIYWANNMFSRADRDFNSLCARMLRRAGYSVFLPQETGVNEIANGLSPTAEDIFRVDTSAILSSNLLVACIDQETIDCGVACEVGIAFACGIPIVGLYTDIRQNREGRGRMYKNLYVVGGIEAVGEIVPNPEDLLRAIEKYLPKPVTGAYSCRPDGIAAQHFSIVAPRYSDFIKRLQSWYTPPWDVTQIVGPWFSNMRPGRILDFGCATGDLANYVADQYPDTFYLGYDKSSTMMEIADTCHRGSKVAFTGSWVEVERYAKEEPFDIALMLFTLHDHSFPQEIVTSVTQTLRCGGAILVADLSSWDLPKLTELLRKGLARPFDVTDSRINPSKLAELAHCSNTVVAECEISMPRVSFPSASDVDEYLEIFGIYRGMDIPLGLRAGKAIEYRRLIKSIIEQEAYPLNDQRAFIACTLKKL